MNLRASPGQSTANPVHVRLMRLLGGQSTPPLMLGPIALCPPLPRPIQELDEKEPHDGQNDRGCEGHDATDLNDERVQR